MTSAAPYDIGSDSLRSVDDTSDCSATVAGKVMSVRRMVQVVLLLVMALTAGCSGRHVGVNRNASAAPPTVSTAVDSTEVPTPASAPRMPVQVPTTAMTPGGLTV